MSAIGERATAQQNSRVMLRPLGSPLPLSFLALFTGSLLLSAIELHWIPINQTHEAAIAILAFTTPLQAVACLFGFLTRDTVSASGVGVLCGTWATTGLILLTSPPGSVSPGLGTLLVIAAGALLVPGVVAVTSKVVVAAVIGAAAARFAISGAYELTDSAAWKYSAGVAGLVVAAMAAYGAITCELESALGRTLLPMLRHHRGRMAMSGRLADQVADVAQEPGVRQQL